MTPLTCGFSVARCSWGTPGGRAPRTPQDLGKGYGTDAVAVPCHYGFIVRGLPLLQIETLSDNAEMLHSAERNGFVREGVLRSSVWVMGEFLDEVLLGLLVQDWKPDSKG